jgi:hypothetical protein
MRHFMGLLCLSLCVAVGCDDGSTDADSLRMNEIQVLGTHNSYHIQADGRILNVLRAFEPEVAESIEYTALPFEDQLELGVRQFELDLFADPEGGVYAIRRGLQVIGEDPVSNLPELSEPGLKVLHIQDIDFDTHCLTFKACLSTLKQWSDANPEHLPIMVMVTGKEEPIDDPLNIGWTIPLPFGPDEVDDIDEEILSVFDGDQLITPDDVRGEYDTLEEAVLNAGWPTLGQARGRFMFAFFNSGTARAHYIEGHPSLQGRVMFTRSVTEGEPETAWFGVNNALDDGERIRELVEAGYMVRTLADADTKQAREGDWTLQDAAFESGAQFVSTDYPNPEEDYFGTGYYAAVPGGYVARCNPITAPEDCDSASIGP